MSTTDLRPPRTTEHLGLPVPGDAAPADAPTDIGALADALDALEPQGRFGFGPGDIKMSAATTVPDGWLICNGQLVSRSVFADLFDVVGTAYGAGDGSTTFAVPDFRNVFPMGAASVGATGARGGAATVALGIAEVPSHNHGGVVTTTDINHTHGMTGAADRSLNHSHQQSAPHNANIAVTQAGPNGAAVIGGTPPNTFGVNGSIDHLHATGWMDRSAAHNHGIPAQGGSAAHENRPPFATVNFLIKT